MPRIPTDAMPAAEFIIRHLYRPIQATTRDQFFAVTETEKLMGGDDWVWTDDNAKVLEFLSRPEVWRRFPQQTLEILRFVRSMCRGPFMFRRISAPRLELAGTRDQDVRYTHSLMHVGCNLGRGLAVIGVRFHDIRTADNLLLSGNHVEFLHKNKRYLIDVENAIVDSDLSLTGHVLTLHHTSELFFTPGRQKLRLGKITYAYQIDARSMLIEVTATLEVDPGIDVSDVVMTIGHDQLSHNVNDVRYNAAGAYSTGAEPQIFIAQQPGSTRLTVSGPSYYAIAQAEIAGFALAVHTRPRTPERLVGADVVVREPGRLHHVAARYSFPGSCRGARLEVAEDKLLTAGGFYRRLADYDTLMREAVAAKPNQVAALDYSISYDYGAEINSFAKCFATFSAESIVPGLTDVVAELQEMFDRYTRVYLDIFVSGHYEKQNTIMSRQLAFVILGVATMYRVTRMERYLTWMKQLCDVLLDFEVRFEDVAGEPASGFPYGIGSHQAAFVDGHSASLLALTQASRDIKDPRLVEAIDRGLAAFCIETCKIDLGRPVKIDVLSTMIGDDTGFRHTENAYWNFNVGLALRLFGALRCSPDPALREIAAKHRDRIELFEAVMHWQLRRSITERPDSIEIRTAVYSGETNSETQPWVMLGLLGHSYD